MGRVCSRAQLGTSKINLLSPVTNANMTVSNAYHTPFVKFVLPDINFSPISHVKVLAPSIKYQLTVYVHPVQVTVHPVHPQYTPVLHASQTITSLHPLEVVLHLQIVPSDTTPIQQI